MSEDDSGSDVCIGSLKVVGVQSEDAPIVVAKRKRVCKVDEPNKCLVGRDVTCVILGSGDGSTDATLCPHRCTTRFHKWAVGHRKQHVLPLASLQRASFIGKGEFCVGIVVATSFMLLPNGVAADETLHEHSSAFQEQHRMLCDTWARSIKTEACGQLMNTRKIVSLANEFHAACILSALAPLLDVAEYEYGAELFDYVLGLVGNKMDRNMSTGGMHVGPASVTPQTVSSIIK